MDMAFSFYPFRTGHYTPNWHFLPENTSEKKKASAGDGPADAGTAESAVPLGRNEREGGENQ